MGRATTGLLGSLLVVSPLACRQTPGATPSAAPPESPTSTADAAPALGEPRGEAAPAATPADATATIAAAPQCAPADWSPRALAPLLEPGKRAREGLHDRAGSAALKLAPHCSDIPGFPLQRTPTAAMADGVVVEVVAEADAGKSGRGWPGQRCEFEVRLADGAGVPTRLGPEQVPPFTNVTALVRSGSAAWLSVTFNGYAREFPKGGNRVIAVDLCQGRVAWQSKDSMSNGGLLLLDDYLISPYGFTSERRHVYVLDSHSGMVIQKLPIVENICPSKSWAPNWKPGERCDAPGQAVGAANLPRVEGGLFLVDTNTGSAAFRFLGLP